MSRIHAVSVGAAAAVAVGSMIGVTRPPHNREWHKGSLHVHTNRGDGNASVNQVINYYQRRGYDFLAISDHNLFTGAATARGGSQFSVLGAEEVSASGELHVNGIGITRLVSPREGPSRRLRLIDNIAAIRAAGGVPLVNHPRLSGLTADELLSVRDGPFILDISEDTLDLRDREPGAMERLWDELLTAGLPVFAAVADDAHYFGAGGPQRLVPRGLAVIVRATVPTPANIVRALERGEYYATTGPVLDEWHADGRRLTVGVRRDSPTRIVFIGEGGTVLSTTTDNPAVFVAPKNHRYIRARIEGVDGGRLWTQPLWPGGIPRLHLPIPKMIDPTAIVDTAAVSDSATVEIAGPPSQERDCDMPPENTKTFGERLLASRRAAGESFARAERTAVWNERPGIALADAAAAVRERYRHAFLASTSGRELVRTTAQHFVYVYPAGYAGNRQPVHVPARVITLETRRRAGDGRLVVYFLNYDKVDTNRPSVVVASAGACGARLALGLYDRGSPCGAMLGRLALSGLPLLTFDEAGLGESSPLHPGEHILERAAEDLWLLDSVLLTKFDRIDLLGGIGSLAPLLADHSSPTASAYLTGQFVPLWTRGDAASGGGPFSSDPAIDHPYFQSSFRWADFLLVAARDGIDIAIALNTGGSGVGKAAVWNETVPVLRRFDVTYQIRGDDPDGDGASDTGTSWCNAYFLADYPEFLRSTRRESNGAPGRSDVTPRGGSDLPLSRQHDARHR